MHANQTVYGSAPINGQLVPELTATQVFPSAAYVPYYQGRGAYTPTLPPPVSFLAGGGNDGWSTGMLPNEASQDPFNPMKSPVLWAVAFLVIGVLGLRHVHWRG